MTTTQEMSSKLLLYKASFTSSSAASCASFSSLMQSHASSFDITFQRPSLARMKNFASAPRFSTMTSGSEVICPFSFPSPNALVIASCPSTRGTPPGVWETKPPLLSTSSFSFSGS
uniref:Uncharacterized protein n=1 Tax=Opuntia streptacantha TaxID=393608 RepID=A0A7C9A6U6_OPUST